ncbi:unnamed protein product [Moneuplotes crassus]|uniref:LisH domain-containing protein ARMC9 n=1 Tax=Euplotes crassus TaxID=5936 RepID=A0AAD1XJM0_EUPCR|nr:unnamed protein product [Moneuplotes crassus]
MEDLAKQDHDFYSPRGGPYQEQSDNILPVIRQASEHLEISAIEDTQNNHLVIQSLIVEYLTSINQIEKAEMIRNDLQVIQTENRDSAVGNLSAQHKLISLYDNGRREEFFKYWRQTISIHSRNQNLTFLKVEFYISLYFCLYPLFLAMKLVKSDQKLNSGETSQWYKREIGYFKKYIDKYGSDFSQTTEFLSFYALSYVDNPITHSSFSKLFTEKWISERRNILIKFLKKEFPERQMSRIEKLLVFHQKYGKTDISELFTKNINRVEVRSGPIGDDTNTFSRAKSQNLIEKDISKEKSMIITPSYHDNEDISQIKEEYQNVKQLSTDLLACMNRIVQSLTSDDPSHRTKIHQWAVSKLKDYGDHLREDKTEFSRQESEIDPQDDPSDFYSEKGMVPNKEFGRATINAGKRKIPRVEPEEFYKTDTAILSENRRLSDKEFKSSSRHESAQSVEEDQAVKLKAATPAPEISKEEIQQKEQSSEYYEDDFEDYFSERDALQAEEEKKTEKAMSDKKLSKTTEFSLIDLNYGKMRDDLSDYSLLLLKSTATSEGVNKDGILEKKTCALLHTLKKMISNYSSFQSGTKMTRRQVLGFLIEHDIFGYYHVKIDTNSKIFEIFPNTLIRLLYSSTKKQEGDGKSAPRVVQYTVALLNAISSIKMGRDYLLPREIDYEHGKHMTLCLIKRIVQVMSKETGDSLLRQYSIGVLQKFSLRNSSQLILIELDMIEKIVSIIRTEYQTISDYSLECLMATLMNLSLRTKGKERMEKIHKILVPLLKGILSMSSGQITIYANGVLFSLITNTAVREFIKQTNLKEFLEETRDDIRNSLFTGNENEDEEDEMPEEDKRQLLVQISYIIQKLEEPEGEKRIQEAENSRIGFSQTEEQDEQLSDAHQDGSKRGTDYRGDAEDEDDDLTDDEELDSTLQSASLLIAEYSLKKVHAKVYEKVHEEVPSEDSASYKEEYKVPPVKDAPKIFQYNQQPSQIIRDSGHYQPRDRADIRMSHKNVLNKRLDVKNKEMEQKFDQANKYRDVRQYQSVNHPLSPYKSEEEEMVFRPRSKLLRTPKDSHNVYRESYEKVTFGNQRPNKSPNFNEPDSFYQNSKDKGNPRAMSSLPAIAPSPKSIKKPAVGKIKFPQI